MFTGHLYHFLPLTTVCFHGGQSYLRRNLNSDYVFTSARLCNAIRSYVLSLCRNLKATLIPVQLNYGEYPTSWLPGIFEFDLNRGKGQTACEWKSTDAKVQYFSTFPWEIIYLSQVLSTLLTQHQTTFLQVAISSETIEMPLLSFPCIFSSFIQPKSQSMSDPSQNN